MKIAAGEVIERPASVVKETVENSIDAGASKISVLVQQGGKDRIVVLDDGEGMDQEDARKCLCRFSTSKIRSAEELSFIRTLGFRGEALSSISAVAHLRIRTAIRDGEGTEVVCQPGQMPQYATIGASKGTTVEVRDLFFNVPARKKYLKSAPVELTHITRTVHTYALSYPNISFSLEADGKRIYYSPGKGWTPELFRGILDRPVAESLYHFSRSTSTGSIEGFLASPEFFSRTPRGIFTFVNHRPVRLLNLYHWIREAVEEIVPAGQYPYMIVFLNLPDDLIDVNVHPSKSEIRFLSNILVQNLVVQGIRDGLGEMMKQRRASGAPYTPLSIPMDGNVHRVIGQVFDTYIAVQEGAELLLIDQHVAAERALYDAFRMGKRLPARELLLPVKVPLPLHLVALAQEYFSALETMGFTMQAREDGLDVRSLPFFLSAKSVAQCIREALESVAESSGLSLRAEEDVMKSLACRLAVKGNTVLSPWDLERLYQKWKESRYPFTCPHGRPVFFRITRDELEQKVKRK